MTRLVRIAMLAILALAPAPLAGCAKGAPTLARPTKATKPPSYRPPSASSVGATQGGGWLTQIGASDPAIAPTGDRLAFVVAGRGLMVADSEGRGATPMAGTSADDREPAWSEAGDQLVAVRATADGRSALVRFAGGRAEVLYSAAAPLKTPAWVPGAGGWLVVEEAGRTGRLLRLGRAGSAPVKVAEGALLAAPTVSADGRTAIVERRALAGGTELARVDLVSGAVTALKVTGTNPRRPAFAPSGRQLAYVADGGVYVAEANGQGGRRVGQDLGIASLAWHPRLPQLVAAGHEGARADLLKVAL